MKDSLFIILKKQKNNDPQQMVVLSFQMASFEVELKEHLLDSLFISQPNIKIFEVASSRLDERWPLNPSGLVETPGSKAF